MAESILREPGDALDPVACWQCGAQLPEWRPLPINPAAPQLLDHLRLQAAMRDPPPCRVCSQRAQRKPAGPSRLRGERVRRKPDPKDGPDAATAYLRHVYGRRAGLAPNGVAETARILRECKSVWDDIAGGRALLDSYLKADPHLTDEALEKRWRCQLDMPLKGRGRYLDPQHIWAVEVLVAVQGQELDRQTSERRTHRLGATELLAIAIALGVEEACPQDSKWRDRVEEKWKRIYQRARPR